MFMKEKDFLELLYSYYLFSLQHEFIKKKCFTIHVPVHVFHVPKITNTGTSRLNLYSQLVVFQSCLPVKHFILLEYSRTYYFHRYNEPFPPKVMKTSLFWGRCRAPQTVVDLCALGRKLEILHLFNSINA